MLEILNGIGGNVVGVRIAGKVTGDDMKAIAGRAERAIDEAGSVRLLVQIAEFGGVEAKALWEKLKFTLAHLKDIERMAAVGDKAWEKWWGTVAGSVVPVKVRYFDEGEIDAAWAWLRE